MASGASTAGYAFTGREWDPETGLYYYRARYYDPKIGRFISDDPIGLAGGDVNLYAYVGNRPLNLSDPFGLYGFDSFLYDSAQFSAGVGDNLSFGLTSQVRDAMGTNDVVDTSSSTYSAGQGTGIAISTATGLAGGLKAAGAKAAGKEFSHWIPNRMGGSRSVLNGNYVTPARHYYHDPFRFPRGYRALGDKWPAAVRQLDRIPNVYKGAAAGAGYGLASRSSTIPDCK
jgi:RHS repeat-associated protein